MKSNQKLNVLFWLFKAKANKDGLAPIYARITIDGTSEEISLGKKVDPRFWDSKNKRVNGPNPETKKINSQIVQVQADLEQKFWTLQMQFDRITSKMVKNVFNGYAPMHRGGENQGKNEAEEPVTLLQVTDDFIRIFQKKVGVGLRSDGTLRHWRNTRNKLAAFILYKFKKADIPLTAIKSSFAEDFYDFMTLEVASPIGEASAKKHLKKTKQILRNCEVKDLIVKNPIQHFVCGGDETDIAPLEISKLEAMYHKNIPIQRLAEVRDAFIFQCFTGFAYQDLYNLQPEHIFEIGNNKEKWLIKNRGKTGVPEMVPILPIVQQILDKYYNHPYCKVHKRLLPVNSNYRYNGYLKEVAIICGIDRELNTHLARHTFADLMLNNGIPLEDVSKMLGHKTVRTTQRYAKVNKERISQNMEKLKEKMFTQTGILRFTS